MVACSGGDPLRTELRTALLAGDVLGAHRFLSKRRDRTRDEDRLFGYWNEKFLAGGPGPSSRRLDPWIFPVVNAYEKYWISVLANAVSAPVAEAQLVADLAAWLATPADGSVDAVEGILAKRLEAHGFQFLGGYTRPFLGPYIWRTERVEAFSVELPWGVRPVTVHWLDETLLWGWLDFASGGRLGTAGWAKPDGIYALWRRYRAHLGKPRFQVSYLKHEAQHQWDFERWGELPPAALEYRAKLVEIAYSPDRRTLLTFQDEAVPGSAAPHLAASADLVLDLGTALLGTGRAVPPEAWRRVAVRRIQEAALSLLDVSNKRLEESLCHPGRNLQWRS